MKVGIEALQASYGDSLFVTIEYDSNPFIIMIDGGTATTYSHKGGKGKTLSGPLKQKLDALKEQGLAIDLMVLTHVDDDHIGGMLRWFENDMPTGSFVKRIWMNDDVEINVGAGLENNSAQAASLKKKLVDNGISFENQKVKGYEENFDWGQILLLAPTGIQHNRIARDIARGLENTVTTRYDVKIKTLIQEKYTCDKVTPENDASIAFLLQTNDGENYLFLGDANVDTIISSLGGIEGLEPMIVLLRNVALTMNKQVVITTHDQNFFGLLQKKIPQDLFNACFWGIYECGKFRRVGSNLNKTTSSHHFS